MNIWFLAATALTLGLAICGIVIVKAPLMDRLIALELGGVLTPLIFMLLAQGLGQEIFYDMALTLAILSLPATLVFVHFLERWL